MFKSKILFNTEKVHNAPKITANLFKHKQNSKNDRNTYNKNNGVQRHRIKMFFSHVPQILYLQHLRFEHSELKPKNFYFLLSVDYELNGISSNFLNI